MPAVTDAMAGFPDTTGSWVWAIESARVMLALNRTLFDLGRDVVRRQQDAAITATLRSLGASAAPDHAPDLMPVEAGFVRLARESVEAFGRISAAMRAASGASLGTSACEAGRTAQGQGGRV